MKRKNDECIKESTGPRCIYLFLRDYESLHQQDRKGGGRADLRGVGCWRGVLLKTRTQNKDRAEQKASRDGGGEARQQSLF